MDKLVDTKRESMMKKQMAMYIGDLVSSCYGVVGLVNVNSIKSAIQLLKKENYQEGVILFETAGKRSVDVHLVLAYGLKVTEIINEINKRLNYFLKKEYGDKIKKINVYIEDLKIL